MSVWDHLIELKNHFIDQFEARAEEVFEPGMKRFNQNGWVNRVWKNESFRRAHLDVVDARDSKGLWMMHVCIFPNLDNDAPIFGFDVISGKKKMTGAFHDFSPTIDSDHHMLHLFAKSVSNLNWKRERELPDWGKKIFSDHMIAAGNVREEEEILQVVDVVTRNLDMYFHEMPKHAGKATNQDVSFAHNNYAHYQKQNPHTPNVMKSLGLNEADVDAFIEDCLFPEV